MQDSLQKGGYPGSNGVAQSSAMHSNGKGEASRGALGSKAAGARGKASDNVNAADSDSQTAKQARTGAVPSQSSSGRGTAGKTTSRTAAADSIMASQAGVAHVADAVCLKVKQDKGKPPQDPGESLVDCRLEVYWSGDEEYYPGVVTSFSPKSVSLHSCMQCRAYDMRVGCILMDACFEHT